MGMVFISGRIRNLILVNGNMEGGMAKVSLLHRMEVFMKANGPMAICMDKEFL